MSLNIPPHPPGYYFCIIARATYKMSNCLMVVLLIFIDYVYLLKFPSKPPVFSSVSRFQEGKSSHTYCRSCWYSIPELNYLVHVQPAKCWILPCQTLSKAISSNWWFMDLTMVSSTDQKVRWLFDSLLPSVFQHHHSIKNKAKMSLFDVCCYAKPGSRLTVPTGYRMPLKIPKKTHQGLILC